MVLRPEEGGLLRLAGVRLQDSNRGLRLPGRGSRSCAPGPLQDDRAALQEEAVVDPAIIFGLPPVRGVHPQQQADVHRQEQEPGEDFCRPVRRPVRLRAEAAGHGPPGRFGHRQFLSLMDPEAEHSPRRVLQHRFQGCRHLIEIGHARRPRERQGLRGLPRMPPSPPGLPSRREGA